jgi:capsular polysaccharide biosynthesis protein
MPTLWKANLLFKTKIRGVATDTKTGLVTVSITWTDAKVAAQWANALVRLANDYLRTQAIDEGERNIAYLTDQAPKMDVLGVKQAMFSILQDEINKVMLARGNVDYALKVVDPAFAPEMTASPKRWVWLFVGMGVSFVLASFYVFIRNAWRFEKAQ